MILDFSVGGQIMMAELRNLRERLSVLIEQRDELVYRICPALEAEYVSKIGVLEYEAAELQLEIRAIKRKTELARKFVNRGQKVSLSEIEDEIRKEFAVYLEAAKATSSVIANNSIKDKPDAETLKEVKQLYKKIVKLIHPDINPDITEIERELFFKAVTAYENIDCELLRVIESSIETDEDEKLSESNPELLRNKADRIRAGILSLETEISIIKSEKPYIYKSFLEDEEEVEARRLVFTEAIEDLKSVLASCEKEFDELIGQ